MHHDSTIPHLEIEIFRAGDYGGRGTYDEAALDRIAADYDPARHEAPVTVDHHQAGPALGWVAGLRRLGDRLLARLTRLSPALADALRAGAYRKRSIELYRELPETGRSYLKAVSFLGAAAPAVKGLADPSFSEAAAAPAVLSFSEDIASAADVARRRLIASGVWRPEWEQLGLPAVFEALGDANASSQLLAFCESLGPAVALGPTPRLELPGQPADHFTEGVVGTPSTQSLERHRRALALQREQPAITYREALLRVS